MGNSGVNLEATLLYADLDASTKLVEKYEKEFVAEIYKVFLSCAASIIKSEDGAIRSYDGDRVMGIFVGGNKNTQAVRASLKINYAVTKLIQPILKKSYPNGEYEVRHVTGVDTSTVMAIRTGVRGDNDTAWIGRSPNYAAKLCALNAAPYNTWITKAVYDMMNNEVKISDGKNMWEERQWTPMNNMTVYRSNYWWHLT